MSNVIMIGSGPAGLSAALYTTRANIDTTVIGKDYGALGQTAEIENYFGFIDPISGKELIEHGMEQAKRLGAMIIQEEVVGLSFHDNFKVDTNQNTYTADSVIIATGISRVAPRILGIKEYEGHGVSYCAVCDAFFYRNKDVAVLGDGLYALHEAIELQSTSRSVTILTNGSEMKVSVPAEIKINTKGIKGLFGSEVLEKVEFDDGNVLSISGLFIAIGVAGSTDLAKKIGAVVDKNKIVVDENMQTNIPGLYAAGDCTGGLLQIAKAVYEGAKAGTQIVKFLRSVKK